MKSIRYPFCLLIIAIVTICVASCQSTVDSFVELRLKKDAEATNKQSGAEVGDGVRLDSASATGKTIRFSYTMLDISKEDINAAVFYKTAKSALIKTADTTTGAGMDFYKKNKVTIAYAYYYKNGTPLSTIIIKPEDYTHKK